MAMPMSQNLSRAKLIVGALRNFLSRKAHWPPDFRGDYTNERGCRTTADSASRWQLPPDILQNLGGRRKLGKLVVTRRLFEAIKALR